MNKVSFYLEKFWLVVAIITACYALYKLMSGMHVSNLEYVFPIIALILFYMRRLIRKRMESANNNERKN